MQYKQVVEQLSKNKLRRESGDLIAIPWSLPRLSNVLPGIEQGRYYLISASPKAGKCLGKDTKIRMADGALKKVQDIRVGEKVLNPFGEPNIILSTTKGNDELYKVSQNNGMDYTVNSKHILSLRSTSSRLSYKKGSYFNLPVKDYLRIAKTTRHRLKGYRSELTEYSKKHVDIDPYWLGLWLGDGDKDQQSITTMDDQVKDYVYKYASDFNYLVSIYHKENSKAQRYCIVNKKGRKNILKQKLGGYNLLYNKHIPDDYKYNTREIRLQVLAGIVDTDGHVSYRSSGSIDITQKSKVLISDITELCYSLGFRVCTSIKYVNGIPYHRVRISGNNMDSIPLKIPYKKAKLISNRKKDLSTSSLRITSIGFGEYYGFTLSGNHLFCLEDYTVSHNSQLCDFMFVFQPIEWALSNPDSDITLKIFYFTLEMSRQSKILAAICHKLYTTYDIVISPQKLNSVFKEYVLEQDILNIIHSDEFQAWLHNFNTILTYYDHKRNPYGIFKVVKDYAEHPDNGHYTYKTTNWQNEDGTYTPRTIRDKYVPVRPNEYVLVIIDHIGLLQPQTEQNLHQAISQYSSEYCLQMRDLWNYSPIIVQQQTADSSKAQFTVRGDTIIDKIKPSQEGLADNKYTARDADLMVSLFYPYKYNIKYYEDIDLGKVGDSHREFMINLNRNGISNASLQLFFLGSSSYFEELPREPNDFDYHKYKSIIDKAK